MNFKIELANEKDVIDVFNLSNDELVRKMSIITDEIDFKTHEEWFYKAINDKNCDFFVIKDENDLIGQVRFEKKEAEIIVSISISKKYRGFNLSYIILQECMQKSKFKNFVAYIKPENIASIKIFEKLNYQFDREIFINNIKLLKYKFGE